MNSRQSKFHHWLYLIPVVIISAYLLLMIPGPEPIPPKPEQNRTFVWNQDQRWEEIESLFVKAKQTGDCDIAGKIDSSISLGRNLIDSLRRSLYPPESQIYADLEKNAFETGALVAAYPQKISGYIEYISELRAAVKKQTIHWNFDLPQTRQRIYRILYGTRAALEEIMLQAPDTTYQALTPGINEQSATPYATVLGVTIHSGDILISRGGVATSALIARGNDYAGNFSHVALIHVDQKTSLISVIESHIDFTPAP